MDPIGLSSLHDFKFSHNRVYPTMVVKNIQTHGFVISEYGFISQEKESRYFYNPQEKTLFPWSL